MQSFEPIAHSRESTNDINPSFLFFFYPSFAGTDFFCQCVAERDRVSSKWQNSSRCPMAITSYPMISLPPPQLLSVSKTKPPHSYTHNQNKALALTSPLSLSDPLQSRRTVLYKREIHQRSAQIWKTNATPEEVLPTDTTPLESTQQIVSTSNDDGVGSIVSVLLFVAFVALSILTIGIIYLGVTDFLQKRETEKLKKEEESKKKGGKKRKVRVRSGPKGFGQKIDEVDEFDD
ncbi:hypothetical protein SADUNF_Sadunf16G0134700 [Salix dunnii]|uniref:Uncharacterized protein n=1 Tax=Salix dunnii TaxID=1413687 RepID=A0A835J9R8_9ROSI|nr:hypothetical protein SADUNF_Sadunf16G0134700 [Salix dunnii]